MSQDNENRVFCLDCAAGKEDMETFCIFKYAAADKSSRGKRSNKLVVKMLHFQLQTLMKSSGVFSRFLFLVSFLLFAAFILKDEPLFFFPRRSSSSEVNLETCLILA